MPVILEHARFLKIPVHSLKFDDQLRFIGRANFDRGHFLTSRFLLNLGALIHR
jgi:hypothetical protein